MSGVILEQIKSLARQSAVYGLADSFGPLMSLALMPVLTRKLTPSDYGSLALLLLFGVGTKILFRMGLDAGFFRIYYDQPGERERRVFTTTILVASGAVSLTLMAITYGLSDFLALRLLGAPRSEWILLVAGDTLLSAFGFIPMSVFRIRGRSGYYLAATLVRNGLNVGLKLGLVLAGWGVPGVLWADLLSSAFFVVSVLPTLLANLGWGFSFPMLRAAAGFGLPKVPHGIAYQALNLADRKILDWYASLAEVGLYHVAYQFGTGIKLFLSAFELAWSPFVYSLIGKADAAANIARIATYVTLALTALALALAVFAREILALFTAPAYHGAYAVIPVVLLAYWFQGFFSLTSVGIGISKKAYYYPLMTFSSAALNIALNLLWIPRFGILGAAWATVAGYALMAAMGFTFSQRHYPMPFEWRRLGRVVAAALICYGLSLTAPEPLGPRLAFKVGVLALYPLALLLVGFLRPPEVARLRALLAGGSRS